MNGCSQLILGISLFIFPKILLSQVDSSQTIVQNIHIVGNEITKNRAIYNQLTFRIGDTLQRNAFEEIKKNNEEILFNSALFQTVHITFLITSVSYCEVTIDVKDRWNVFPLFIFEFADPNFNTWLESGSINRINVGLGIQNNNFLGMNRSLQIFGQVGYSDEFDVLYFMPDLTKDLKYGFIFHSKYWKKNEVNYQTTSNKRDFLTLNESLTSGFTIRTGVERRISSNIKHSLLLGYQYVGVGDSVIKLQPNYFLSEGNKSQLIDVSYYYLIDNRDYRPFPKSGIYFKNQIRFTQSIYQSHQSLLNITTDWRGYYSFNKKWNFASSLKTKVNVFPEKTYYIQRGLGYRNQQRGYGYSIIDGQHYFISQSYLRRKLFSTGWKNTPFLKLPFFDRFFIDTYMNSFFEISYVSDHLWEGEKGLANQINYSYGVGLEAVTIYDKLLRFDVSYNKQGEWGYFLFFIQPF